MNRAADACPGRRSASFGLLDANGDPARYDGLQVLRAVAALLVLAAHARTVAPASWSWLHPWTHGGGAIGVDVFFVISGFVVAMSADRPGVTARGFLLDRATRVLPLYLVMSLPFLAAGEEPTWPRLWNTFLFLPALDFGPYTDPAHPFGWSVGAELWLYLVFAAALRWAPGGRRAEALAAAAALLVAAGCLLGGVWALPRFAGLPLFLEFAAGALLHRHRRALGRRAAAVALAPAGAVLACLAATAMPGLGHHPDTLGGAGAALLRTAFWGAPALLLVAGVVALDRRPRRVRWPAALVRAGDRSYSFYLVQPFAIAALRGVDWADWRIAWAALLASAAALAWASHRWIERPATARLRALLGSRGRGGTLPIQAATARTG